MSQQRGFLGCIFDFSFSEFVTTKIIKILYFVAVCCSIFIPLQALFAISILTQFIAGPAESSTFLIVLAALPVSCICILISRVFLELVIVAFRIAENTGKLVQRDIGDKSHRLACD